MAGPANPASPRRWPQLISTLVAGHDLTAEDTAWAMDQVMSGATTPVELAGFLVALSAKGETVDELAGLAEAMLNHAVPIEISGDIVDLVGTGGDGANTVNISTMASIVAAGAGLRIVKHGNRAASSASGAADVLEALGVRLDLTVPEVAAVFDDVGITFCFAQTFHPSFRHAATARSQLGIATAFNVLGPLTNPARPQAAAIGVANARIAPLVAGVLASRGTRALVFRGEDGLDELTTTAAARVWEVAEGEVTEHVVDAAQAFDLAPATLAELRGADAAFNAEVAREVLAGRPGPIHDAVVLNAAAAIVAHGGLLSDEQRRGTLEDRLGVGVAIADEAISSGAAADVLHRWVRASSR